METSTAASHQVGAATRYLLEVLSSGVDSEGRQKAESEIANRDVDTVHARELRPGDRVLAWRHAGYPAEIVHNWVVKAPFGQIQPSGSWGVAMEKPDPNLSHELNLWITTDWNDETIFYVDRSAQRV